MLAQIISMSAYVGLVTVVAAVYYFWEKTFDDDPASRSMRQLLGWLLKGLGLPLSTWFILNTGWLPGIPTPLGPAGNVLPGTTAWLRILPDRLAGSFALIASFWGAVSLSWLLATVVPAIEKRRDVQAIAGFWTLVALPFAALLLWLGGWTWIGFAAMVSLGPALYGLQPLRNVRPPMPFYSRAVAQLKFGKYAEAEQAVLAELEKCADDFDGWMMLAALYAEQFHDLPLADQTVRDVCAQPNVQPFQVALAFHRLADWHLKLGQDPLAARRAMSALCERLPNTHFTWMAKQRLQRLPRDRQELLEQQEIRPIRLPSLKDPLDDDKAPEVRSEPSPEALQRAQRCIQQLERDPNQISPREELAHLLAEQLGNVDSAIEQVGLLLDLPARPAEKTPEWLSLLAAWHLRHRHDPAAARRYLERLVRDHPHAPQAFAAQRRLNLLDLEKQLRPRTDGPPPNSPTARLPPG